MVYWNGIDVSSKTITLSFDYDNNKEEELMKLVKEKFGNHIDINDIDDFIPELEYN